ncbi:carbohydrate binding domain-containing protein [Geoglobus acetivorans]|uniref:Putative membrane protein n=1 Tax=Geoglobus acetivorans TaxID=565033 RepID=A0A0A7GC02_GEOAI|nr:putative membrane protein [Geoglobus acetivorans]
MVKKLMMIKNWYLLISLSFLYALLSKWWLISALAHNHTSIVFLQGAKPVAAPAYYTFNNLFYTWLSVMSRPMYPLSFYNPINLIYVFPSIYSWILYECMFPWLGGLLFSIFIVVFIKYIEKINSSYFDITYVLFSGFIGGFIYETILLSPWLDIWTKAFVSLVPLILIFAMLALDKIKEGKFPIKCALFTAVAITFVYDIRITLASIIVIFILSILILFILDKKAYIEKSKRWVLFLSVVFIITGTMRILSAIIPMFSKTENPFGGFRTLTLPVIVGNYDLVSVFGLPFPLIKEYVMVYCIFLIFLTLILSSLLLIRDKYIKKTILFLMIPIVFVISVIWVYSPFKFIHKMLTEIVILGIDVGVMFRTPRFFITITGTLVSLIAGLLAYYIWKRKLKYLQALLVVFIVLIGGLNIYLNNNEQIKPLAQRVSILPKDYQDVYYELKQLVNESDVRVLYILRTGKYEVERPPWLKSICWGILEKSFNILTYFYYGRPMEYLYRFIMKEGIDGNTQPISTILSYLDVKYLIVTTDYKFKSMREKSIKIINYLSNSSYFEEKWNNTKIFIFEIKRPVNGHFYVSSCPFILISGGYSSLSTVINSGTLNNDNGILFSDQIIPLEALDKNKIGTITTVKGRDTINDLITQLVYWKKVNGIIVVPSKFTLGIDKSKWHPFFIANPHHGEWEVFYIWPFKGNVKYEFDFRNDWGFVGATKPGQKLDIPITIKEGRKYIILIRYLGNAEGGKFAIKINNNSLTTINTFDKTNSFKWALIQYDFPKKGEYSLTIKNIGGRNAINIILSIPEKEYYRAKQEVEKLLQNKTIIYLFEAESDLYRGDAKIIKDFNASNGEMLSFGKNDRAWQDVEMIKPGTYRLALKGMGEFRVRIGDEVFTLKPEGNFSYTPPFHLDKGDHRLEIAPLNVRNILQNPSFEDVFAGLPESWNIGNTKDFKIGFDRGYDGNYSLKVSTSTTGKRWSWIRSEPMDVEPGRDYLITTHMKYRNVKASHVKLEAYYPEENRWRQLTPFIPGGKSGTSAWQKYSAIIKIPENATEIRVVLNAGWVLDEGKGEAITWFDDISVIPLDEAPKLDVVWLYSTETNQTVEGLFEVKERPAEVVNYTKINPTLWKVKVNATKPFMLSFAEAYDPLWEARIYRDGVKVGTVKSIPLYSVINGFWINETGNLEIVIRYKPQDWFEIGLMISGLTFAGCIGYLFFDWRREKGDGWALKVQNRVKKFRWKLF